MTDFYQVYFNWKENQEDIYKENNQNQSNLTFLIWLLSKNEIQDKTKLEEMKRMQDHKINGVLDAFASVDQNELSAFIKQSTIKKIFKTQSYYSQNIQNIPLA